MDDKCPRSLSSSYLVLKSSTPPPITGYNGYNLSQTSPNYGIPAQLNEITSPLTVVPVKVTVEIAIPDSLIAFAGVVRSCAEHSHPCVEVMPPPIVTVKVQVPVVPEIKRPVVAPPVKVFSEQPPLDVNVVPPPMMAATLNPPFAVEKSSTKAPVQAPGVQLCTRVMVGLVPLPS